MSQTPARRATRTQPAVPAWTLVAFGGALGALCRWGVGLLYTSSAWPWATLIVNLVGAFVLGALTARVALHPAEQRWQQARLLLGTGFCGALTTYSTLIADAVHLNDGRGTLAASGWLGAQIVFGLVCAGVGFAAAERIPVHGERTKDTHS